MAAIMEEYGVQKSYVYKLACTMSWRRTYDAMVGGAPYVRYHKEDVADALKRDRVR